MLAKRTSKNQITLPKAVIEATGVADYYDVNVEGGCIVMTPVRLDRAEAVRSKLTALGICETDINDAVSWARQT
ncbi:MAG: AbrB/MazE/SpoVT family DNA-binding domain-containing protein [Cyanobacteriota bacterium]|nr:AbrB/MazE/SpoVT family DNA-binding domain-containing protein [Cyanobacteriota bacterium]